MINSASSKIWTCENSLLQQFVFQTIMWFPNDFLLYFALIFTTSEAVFTCPSLFNWYPDIYDCSKFYRCMWGKSNSFTCPSGTLWSQELLTCDHEDHVKCEHGSQPIYHAHGHSHGSNDKGEEAPDFSVDYHIDISHLGNVKSGWDYEKGDEEEHYSDVKSDSQEHEEHHDYDHFDYSEHSQESEEEIHEHEHYDQDSHESESQTDHSHGESEIHSHPHSVKDQHGSMGGSAHHEDHEGHEEEATSHSLGDSGFSSIDNTDHYIYDAPSPVYSSSDYYDIHSYIAEEKPEPEPKAATLVLQKTGKGTVQATPVVLQRPQPLMQPQVIVHPPQTIIQSQPPVLISHSAAETAPASVEHDGDTEKLSDFIINKLLQLPRYGGHFYNSPVGIVNTDGTYDVVDLEVSPAEVSKIQKIEPYKLKRSAPVQPWPMSDFFRAGYGYKKIYH